MKFFLIIITFFSFSFPLESYLSLYGLGEKTSNLNPSSISLGWSNLFNSNNYLNSGSLSELYSSDLVRLSMGADFNFNSINENKYYNNKMNYYSFLFPLKKNKTVLGFSLSPFYRINSHLIEDEYSYFSNQDTTFAYKSEYEFEGGPSVISTLFSSKLNNHISFGIKGEYVFGSLYTYKKHTVYNIENNIDTDGNIETNYNFSSNDFYTTIKNYQGYGITLEGSFKNFKNNRFGIGGKSIFLNKDSKLVFSISLINQIKIIEYLYDDIVPEALELGYEYNQKTEYKLTSPFEFNVGFSQALQNNQVLTIEYYLYQPYETEFDFNILNNPDLDKNRLSIGYYKNFINQNLTFSLGLYKIDSMSDQISSNRKGITVGLGVNSIENISLDFCLEIGKNKTTITEVFDENYINLYLGLSTSDKWFK